MYFYKQNVLCGHFFLSHVLVQNKTKRKKNNHINSVLDSVLVQKLNAPAGYGAVCVCVCGTYQHSLLHLACNEHNCRNISQFADFFDIFAEILTDFLTTS